MDRPPSRPRNRNGNGVALVSLPFADVNAPSIALGLLKAGLLEAGVPCTDVYLNLDLARRIGPAVYGLPKRFGYDLVGDWVFAGALGGGPAAAGPYAGAIARRNRVPASRVRPALDALATVRVEAIAPFLDHGIAAVDWSAFELVGLTTTFQQLAAAVAFARRLRLAHPDVPVIAGGAFMKGAMGAAWLAAEPAFDYAGTGDGTATLPALVAALRAGLGLEAVPNLAWRAADGTVATSGAAPPLPLDTLPVPDYDGFFAAREAARAAVPGLFEAVMLPFQASSGCWWGAKNHCTFCSLNGPDMAYRTRSPARVLAEFDHQSRRYRVREFCGVDNIMERTFPDSVLAPLAATGADLSFFLETKANLSLEELRRMRRAGVLHIQPGIESLSTEVLRLMRKGVSGIQNVFLLKWCRYFGIKVSWNVLTSFAGETRAHYDRMLAWVPLLVHLDPPHGVDPVALERHSPLHDDPAAHRITAMGVPETWRRVWGFHGVDLAAVCTSFDYAAERDLDDGDLERIRAAFAGWQTARAAGAALSWAGYPDGSAEIDDRRGGGRRRHVLAPERARVHELAGVEVSSIAKVRRGLETAGGRRLDAGAVRGHLDALVADGLAITEDGRYLTLAVPESRRYTESAAPIIPPPSAGPGCRQKTSPVSSPTATRRSTR